jgi:hypothetical protein
MVQWASCPLWCRHSEGDRPCAGWKPTPPLLPMARLQATVALARYRLRTRDLADLLEKNRSTVTRWLNAGLKREREDDGFIRRLDTLDHAISSHEADNAPMRYVAR